MGSNDYEAMNVEQLHEMVNVDNLETMATQARGWYDTATMFQQQIDGLQADLATAKKTWHGDAAERYFLEIENTIKSMENAKDVANGNGMAWSTIKGHAESTRTEINEQYRQWMEAKGSLKDKEDADDGFQGADLLDPIGQGNNVSQEDYDEKRKKFDIEARRIANNYGTKMEDEYYKNVWNPETLNDYKPPPDPGDDVPPWPDHSTGGTDRPGTGDPGGPGTNRPQPPPGHGVPPELQTPPPPPPVQPPPPVGPPPVLPPPPIGGPPPGPAPIKPPPTVKPPVGKPPVARPTPPPNVKPPIARPTPPPTVKPPVATPPGRPPTTAPPTGPRPPGRTVPPVIGGRQPMPPTTTTGPIANAQRPSPTVRPISPQVIGQRPVTGPNTPGIRANPMTTPMTPGKAGMDTRGVFGARPSKMGGAPQAATPGGGTGAGVRSAATPVGGHGVNRGVIMGAKKPAGGGSAPVAGGGGARGKVRRRDEERTATIASDGPLDDAFSVDRTVVPGVIRGWTPPENTDHTAGPAMFGERPGKAANQRKKKIEDEWDDW